MTEAASTDLDASAEFDSVWARLSLLLNNPEHFSILFIFSSNDMTKNALFERLKNNAAVQNRDVLWPMASDRLQNHAVAISNGLPTLKQ